MNSAERKRRENKIGSAISTGLTVGIVGILLFGAVAPIAAAPLAVGAAAGALAFDRAAYKAKDDMRRAECEIRDTRRTISDYETAISSLNNTISQLNQEERHYSKERNRLEREKARIKKVIAFLLDAKMYGNQYSKTAQTCSHRTTLVEKVASTAEKKGYSLFDSNGTEQILTSFEKAWEAFEEMNEKGQSYVFTIDFQCQCNCSRNEIPYVSSGKLICASCFEKLQ